MRYPEFLKENGTIGFVAPSFGCATEPYISRLDSALAKFKELGYKLDLGPNCKIAEGIGISNTPEKCGEELNSFYKSDNNDALISVGGGELMCEVVPYMDFDMVKNSTPKWYMGYSDNTNFVFTSATLADTAAIYSPCAGDFGMKPWHQSIQDAFDLLTGKKLKFSNYDLWELEQHGEGFDANEPYNMTEKNVMKAFVPSSDGRVKEAVDPGEKISFEGRIVGGCLDCLANLVGTPYDKVKEFNEKYASDGIIWFIESCDLNVFSIRRTLWNLKETGWFSNLRGFLIGRPGCYGEDIMGLNQYNAVTDILGEDNVPILMDLDIGHHPPMIPIVCGSIAEVNFTDNHFEIEYKLK